MQLARWASLLPRIRSVLCILRLTAAIVCFDMSGALAVGRGFEDYRISVGDTLQLDFLDDDAVPFPLSVGGSGEVQLPFLGTIGVAGLTLGQAQGMILRQYVDRKILVAPQIDLSIFSLRPLSVLGDVEKPGFFDYRPDITVEQAIGLAGGPIRAANGEEARSLQRVALRGEIAGAEASILREGVATARLRTQLAGGIKIDPVSLELNSSAKPDQVLITSLITQDEQMIVAERNYFTAERKLLEQALEDVKLQIGLTQDQINAQTRQIASYDAELKSSAELSGRGLIAAPVRARLLRQVSDEETALLRLRTNLAETQRLMAGLERELLGLDFRRAQTWRQDLAESQVRSTQFKASRVSLLDQLALLDDWSRRGAQAEVGPKFGYLVRRRTSEGGQTTKAVVGTEELLPGDVLVVHLVRNTAIRVPQGGALPG